MSWGEYMLNLEKINKAINDLEKNGGMNSKDCADLANLYMIRDKLKKKTEKTEPLAKSETIDLNIYPTDFNKPFSKTMAEEWANKMQNVDGTVGPHWTFDQAKQVMEQKEISGSTLDFWVSLNMAYSDYGNVARKLGVNVVDFCAEIAEAFLNDKDAVGGGGSEKLSRYYEYVVK